MTSKADNPATETANLFYGTPETVELNEPTDVESVTSDEVAEPEGETLEESNPNESEAESEDELEESEGDSDDDSEEEAVYLELDGEDVDLNDVREWKAKSQESDDGKLRQADYTRKTTALAEERKEFEAKRDEDTAKLSELHAELQALVAEDEAVDLAELKEYDPEKYIEVTERMSKRKAATDKYLADNGQPAQQFDVAAEQNALVKAHPEWWDAEGKETKQMGADKALVESYWKDNPPEQSLTQSSKYIEASLKAAKYDALQAKAKTITSKVKKAPLVTKAKKASKAKPKAAHELFYS